MFVLDLLILSCHQRFASWFQKWTCKTCFWLARTCAHGAAICLILCFCFAYNRVQRGGLQFYDAVDLIAVIFLVSIYRCIRTTQDRERQYEKSGVYLFTEVIREYRINRLASVAVCIASVACLVVLNLTVLRVIETLLWFCMFTSAYFLICTPLPPNDAPVRRGGEIRQGA